MKLRQLLKNSPDIEVKGSKDIEITGIASHSSCVAPGYIFVAKRGRLVDGNTFIPGALSCGAVAVLSDMFDPSIKQVTQLKARNVSEVEGALAAAFWQYPSRELDMIGITGTSGKTTTSYLIRQLFTYFKKQSGLIGTVSCIVGSREYEASHTTPDVISNQRFLREVVKAGCEACVMEVTSHALHQGRVASIDFDTAIFTNLTHEHLDYHISMDAYAEEKAKLFASLGTKKDCCAIYHAEDPFSKKIVGAPKAYTVSFGIDCVADVAAKHVVLFPQRSEFSLEWRGESVSVSLPLAGRFNVLNALAAASLFLFRGYSLQDVANGLSTVASPPGRLELVRNEEGLTIYVDYAHKEDALKKVLQTLKESTQKKLILVFGCGGDRDREKRPKMARAAETYADIIFVTTDNPRSEPPDAIIEEICGGFEKKVPWVVPDRRSAIEQAIALATPDDVVLIAGKGHEKKQIFAHETIFFDDREVALQSCRQRNLRNHV